MKRTWGFDALRCPRCSRKMRVLATITDPAVVHKILEHLGVARAVVPRRAPWRANPVTPYHCDGVFIRRLAAGDPEPRGLGA
jgi:hypothetical protein